MKPVYQTFEQWARQNVDEKDIMFFTAVARQLSMNDAHELEQLSQKFFGHEEAVHEMLNELEIETIVRMYGMNYSITDISRVLGERDNKHVISQLFFCNKISVADLSSYAATDYDFYEELLHCVSEEDLNKDYYTRDQIINELVEYMNEREQEEDYAIAHASYSNKLVHLQHCVKNYIDGFRTRVTDDDIMEIALTVLNKMN